MIEWKMSKEEIAMLATVEGYYDGRNVVLSDTDKKKLHSGQQVIITLEIVSDNSEQATRNKRWEAFERLETTNLEVPQDFDYQAALAMGREEKYGNIG